MSLKGWIKLYRNFEGSRVFSGGAPSIAMAVVVAIRAAYEDTAIPSGIVLRRGQAVYGQNELARLLRITRDKLRTAQDRLVKEGFMRIVSARRGEGTVVELCEPEWWLGVFDPQKLSTLAETPSPLPLFFLEEPPSIFENFHTTSPNLSTGKSPSISPNAKDENTAPTEANPNDADGEPPSISPSYLQAASPRLPQSPDEKSPLKKNIYKKEELTTHTREGGGVVDNPVENGRCRRCRPSFGELEEFIRVRGYILNPRAFWEQLVDSDFMDKDGNDIHNWKLYTREAARLAMEKRMAEEALTKQTGELVRWYAGEYLRACKRGDEVAKCAIVQKVRAEHIDEQIFNEELQARGAGGQP